MRAYVAALVLLSACGTDIHCVPACEVYPDSCDVVLEAVGDVSDKCVARLQTVEVHDFSESSCDDVACTRDGAILIDHDRVDEEVLPNHEDILAAHELLHHLLGCEFGDRDPDHLRAEWREMADIWFPEAP